MNLVSGLKYSKEHEWIKVEGDEASVGITNYAQLQLGDIVFVEEAEVDLEVEKDEVVCAVESVKTAADIFTPISGTILQVNEKLDEEPEFVNQEPYEAWILKIRISDMAELDELMSEEEYAKFCEQEDK